MKKELKSKKILKGKEMRNMKNSEKGITLIALIITIIVMLILVAVTINVALNGGLFNNAKEAKDKTQKAAEKEELMSIAFGTLNSNGKLQVTESALEGEGWNVNNTILDSDNVEWYLCTSPKGNEYYINTVTGEISEEQPPEGGPLKINHEIAELKTINATATLTVSGTGAETCTWESEDEDLVVIEGSATGKTVTIKRVGASEDPICITTITATSEDNQTVECYVMLEGMVVYLISDGTLDNNKFEETSEVTIPVSIPAWDEIEECYKGIVTMGGPTGNYSIDVDDNVIIYNVYLTEEQQNATTLKGDILWHDENYENFINTMIPIDLYDMVHNNMSGPLCMTSKSYLSSEFADEKFISTGSTIHSIEFTNDPTGKYPQLLTYKIDDTMIVQAPYYVKKVNNNPDKIYAGTWIFDVDEVNNKTAIKPLLENSYPYCIIQTQ